MNRSLPAGRGHRAALRAAGTVGALLLLGVAAFGAEDGGEAGVNPIGGSAGTDDGNKAHLDLLRREGFPSAQECAVCHPDHFREWSVSPHAYAQISPTFNAYQATLVEVTN